MYILDTSLEVAEIPAVTWCDKTPIYFMNVGFNAQGDKFIRPC